MTKQFLVSVSCGNNKAHDLCPGHYEYPPTPLPPLLANADPFISKFQASITFERSRTITAASRPNHKLLLMCRCPCHLYDLLAEQERLSNLRSALEVGLPHEGD